MSYLICVIILIFIFILICIIIKKYNIVSTFISNKALITFIIPSIGRDTLLRTIQSLKNQTSKNWEALIIFDGIKPTIKSDDNRIKIIQIDKTGKDPNSAGGVRNVGLKMINTEWVGFVDDDDTLSKNYVEYLIRDTQHHNMVDVIIFRMRGKHGHILPSSDDDNFYVGRVGISFAIKTTFYKKNNLYFTPSWKEDYEYLNEVRTKNTPMLISSNVAYFVESDPIYDNQKYKEILINAKPNLYCFWTGDNEISLTRQNCFKSMKNSELNVILIDKDNLNNYILKEHPLHLGYKYLSETHKADYLRTYFMNFIGGGYSDIKYIKNSWIPSYNKLNDNQTAMIIGYQEIEGGVANLNDKLLQSQFEHFIGNGSYICKPNTEFTNEWYSKMIKVMDNKYDKLKHYPSRNPTDIFTPEYPYPLKWTELLGDIFHLCIYKYKNHVLKGLPIDFIGKDYK